MFINGDAIYKIEKLLIHVKCCKNDTSYYDFTITTTFSTLMYKKIAGINQLFFV